MVKKAIIILLVLIVVLNSTVFSLASTNFSDLSNHWAEENIENLASKGIIDGYSDGTFKPEGTVTYGEFIKMLVVAVTGENPGVSTDGNHWTSSYYEIALDNDILRKDDMSEEFLPNNIPRADMAYLASKCIDETLTSEKKDLIESYIKDINVAGNRKSEVIFAYGTGILTGYPDKTFKPSGVLTRAESAAVISRIINPDLRLEIDFEEEVENKDKITLSKDVQLIDYTSQVPDSAKRPIDEVAANLREDYKETVKYYTIAENNPYNFFVSLNLLGEEGIGIEGKATKAAIVFIIKDNTIIYYTQDFNLSTNDYIIYNLSGYDEIKLPDFDYIGFLKRGDFESDTMILIENPFK